MTGKLFGLVMVVVRTIFSPGVTLARSAATLSCSGSIATGGVRRYLFQTTPAAAVAARAVASASPASIRFMSFLSDAGRDADCPPAPAALRAGPGAGVRSLGGQKEAQPR